MVDQGTGAPAVLQGKNALGIVTLPGMTGTDLSRAVEHREERLKRLASSAGLDLKRIFAEREGWSRPISERPEILAAIEAIKTGEAEVIVTSGPGDIGPTVGEQGWFFSQLDAAGGIWWMGGSSVLPRGEDEPSFAEELDRFAEEIEEGRGGPLM